MSEPFYTFLGFFYVAASTVFTTICLSKLVFDRLVVWIQENVERKEKKESA